MEKYIDRQMNAELEGWMDIQRDRVQRTKTIYSYAYKVTRPELRVCVCVFVQIHLAATRCSDAANEDQMCSRT